MTDADAPCNGCTRCAMRCTDGIAISEFEFTRIREYLRALPPAQALRVLEQEKRRPWSEEASYTACLFLDVETDLCLVYPARPLICRLFGRVRHLPCPIERIPAVLDADRVLDAYTAQPLGTFQHWMARHGVFNFTDLLGAACPPARYEL
ncbi:MAG: Flagellin N-methylase [bacterium ADurb.Bin429]|nr:MAG: Flagellin N-methylase [bacterium ADurb.Bin429]